MKYISYPQFQAYHCLAQDCPMNCCLSYRINYFKWEEEQFGKREDWNNIDGKGGDLRDYVFYDKDGCHLNRDKDGNCVFLHKHLCSIQEHYGMNSMPSVCRTYPRLITRLEDRVELALDPCCPGALYTMEHWHAGDIPTHAASENDMIRKRDMVMAYFADDSHSLQECLQFIADTSTAPSTVPQIDNNDARAPFLRKAAAFLVFSYYIPYHSFPGIKDNLSLILDMIGSFLQSGRCHGDFRQLCIALAAHLEEYVQKIGFDVEFEDRYMDLNDIKDE